MSLNPANPTPANAPTPRLPVYVRGQANTASWSFSRAGVEVEPSAVTYTLLSPSGSTVVTGAATISGGTASYALTTTELPSTVALSAGYLERWEVTFDSGDPARLERQVVVGLRELRCPVDEASILRLFPRLASQRTGILSDFQGFIDEAWTAILFELIGAGIYPQRVVDPSALRQPCLHLAKYHIFTALGSTKSEGNSYAETADKEWARWEAAWSKTMLALDGNDDGLVDDEGRTRQGARMSTFYAGGASTEIGPWAARARGW